MCIAKKMNAVLCPVFVVLLIKQTTNCSSVPWIKKVNFAFLIFVALPEDFRDAFCVAGPAGGAFGRPGSKAARVRSRHCAIYQGAR